MAATDAVQLVLLDPDTGKYEVGQEAAGLLAQLDDNPVAAVSIAGALRQGKSFILNKLASTTGGFPVSPLQKPCTHGIWMRTKHVDVDGERRTIVFLDTEGTASYEQTAQSSATIVSLAGLVSSLLIYNKRGVFDEDCVESLFSAAHILEKLFKVEGEGADPTEDIMSPPQLLVLLRDWCLDLAGSTPTEHLLRILDDRPLSAADMKGIKEKNKQRSIIRSVFSQSSCHVLPHPGCDTKIMEGLPDSKMSEDFVRGISELSAAVFSQATPKLVHGKPMTGPVMLRLLEAAVKAINTPGQDINLPTVWGAVVAMELQAAAAAAGRAYDSATASFDDCVGLQAVLEMHKAGVTASETAHRSLCSNASKEECTSAWQKVLQQLDSGFAVVSERMKRKEAEAILQHAKLVDAARLQAQKALDQDSLLASLAEKGVLDASEAEAAFKERRRRAMSVYDKAVYNISTTLKASSAAPFTAAAVKKARRELIKVLQNAHDTMMVQLDARVAMDQARQAAAEQQLLEQEGRMQQAKDAAITVYRDWMKHLLIELEDMSVSPRGDSMATLTTAHEESLSELYQSMPKDLSESQRARFKQDVCKACEEVHATNKQVLQQRIQQADRDVLKKAVHQGLKTFQQAVKNLPTDCSDPAVAKKTCSDATAAALMEFTSVASKQSSFPSSSMVYMAAEDGLCMDMAARAQQLQNAADALQKSQQAAQAALRQQREEVEAARQQEQLRVRQMEQQLQRQREENERRERERQEQAEEQRRQLERQRAWEEARRQQQAAERERAWQEEARRQQQALERERERQQSCRVYTCYAPSRSYSCEESYSSSRSSSRSTGNDCGGGQCQAIASSTGQQCRKSAQPGRRFCYCH